MEIKVRKIGLQPYERVRFYQKDLQKRLINGLATQTLIICEHPPVITLGSSAKEANILISREEAQERNIEIIRSERGGDVTCHSPGQIVLYPIIDLNLHKRDVDWYMRSLEQLVINTLSVYGIKSFQIAKRTGVWTDRGKIAAIGVRISRWRTMHGIALNFAGCLDTFRYIHPCGLIDAEVTEMSLFFERNLDKNEVINNLIMQFNKIFNFNTVLEENCFDGQFAEIDSAA